jgi:hypothetical protein
MKVQPLRTGSGGIVPVEPVAQHGVSFGGQVEPDLVGSSGEGAGFQ